MSAGASILLATAILRGAAEKKIVPGSVANFQSITGKGVTGTVERHEVALGNIVLLKELSIPADMLRDGGGCPAPERPDGYVHWHRWPGRRIFSPSPTRSNRQRREAVKQLKESDLRIIMLTGDNQTTAETVTRKLGITELEAGVTPERKAAVIRELQAKRFKVAMAGDGINDAPALAQADVGIAMATGTDVAMQSAGITLLKGDLMGIVRARRLSRATMRNIRQNLFFAFIYNALGIPVAAGVLYPFFHLQLSPGDRPARRCR